MRKSADKCCLCFFWSRAPRIRNFLDHHQQKLSRAVETVLHFESLCYLRVLALSYLEVEDDACSFVWILPSNDILHLHLSDFHDLKQQPSHHSTALPKESSLITERTLNPANLHHKPKYIPYALPQSSFFRDSMMSPNDLSKDIKTPNNQTSVISS